MKPNSSLLEKWNAYLGECAIWDNQHDPFKDLGSNRATIEAMVEWEKSRLKSHDQIWTKHFSESPLT